MALVNFKWTATYLLTTRIFLFELGIPILFVLCWLILNNTQTISNQSIILTLCAVGHTANPFCALAGHVPGFLREVASNNDSIPESFDPCVQWRRKVGASSGYEQYTIVAIYLSLISFLSKSIPKKSFVYSWIFFLDWSSSHPRPKKRPTPQNKWGWKTKSSEMLWDEYD